MTTSGFVEHENGAGMLPPLGVSYVASAARAAGHSVRILDERICRDKKMDILREVRDWQPDIVAMPCFMNDIANCARIAALARRAKPDIRVILGGSHPTILPDECMRRPEIDAIVIGEGETSFCRLIKDIEDDKKLGSIPGIWFKDARGRVVKNPRGPLIADIDTVPRPAFELWELERYFCSRHVLKRKAINVVSSRGCPYDCTYCACAQTFGHVSRYHSGKRVVDDLNFLYERFGFDSFMFYDDLFTANRKRTIELCGWLMRRRKGKFRWTCCTRTDRVDRGLLDAMRNAGCEAVSYGCESGSQRLLDRLRKGTTVKQNFDAIRMTREAGISVSANFMLGLPTETDKETAKTLDFAARSGLDHAWFMLAEPFPGTRMWDDALANGYFVDGKNRKVPSSRAREDRFSLIWVPNGRTRKEMECWLGRAEKLLP